MGLRPSLQADIALLGAAAVWGCTFVVVKRALEDASPFAFLAARFLVGAAVLGWIFRRRIFPARLDQLRDGSLLGLFIGGGFAFQTFGLLHTTPSRSAFITGLYVVIVPLLAAALGLRGINAGSLIGAGLALAGLRLMTAGGPGGAGGLGPGEVLTIACAILFAAHIVWVDILTRRHDAGAMAFWQVAVTAVACLAAALLAERPRFTPTPSLMAAIAVTGVAATALTLAVQNSLQARTTPSRAAIVFATEPVFAAITSYAVEGEIMTGAAMAGAGVILAGMIVAEIPLPSGTRSRS